ncbi:hypothetical protein ACFQJD_07400 [Haloplanus sp. GCM10025708]|uniref:hypothetical protein n=1 Tax=Haloferacaceae TaxID=1644056 RepID=UPI0036139864
MGFSVSGSAAIVFIGMFIAFGTMYTATSNGFERLADARGDVADETLERQNTALSLTTATYNSTSEILTLEVNNSGTTSLSVNGTDVLVDNAYQTSFVVREVDGDATTDLWLPGETLHIELSVSDPSRVTVVSGPGVAVSEVV